MAKNLLLVDYENVPKIDLSGLDDSYRAIVFVGASQNPKAAKNAKTAHRFQRVEFQNISGTGKNALDSQRTGPGRRGKLPGPVTLASIGCPPPFAGGSDDKGNGRVPAAKYLPSLLTCGTAVSNAWFKDPNALRPHLAVSLPFVSELGS